MHIVGRVRIVGDQRVEAILNPRLAVEKWPDRRFFTVVQRQQVDQTTDLEQRFHIIVKGAVCDRRFGRMRPRTAQVFGSYNLVGHGFHHVGPRHKHIGAIADHEDKVGHRRRINRPARTRPHNHADLRHHTRGHDVFLKDIRISTKRINAFLNSRATGIVQTDHRGAVFHRHIHDLANLLCMRRRKRSA